MNIKTGIIPTVIGTAVAATGVALKNTNLPESYRNGIIGFGLANITLGSVEMISENVQNKGMFNRVTKAINMSMK